MILYYTWEALKFDHHFGVIIPVPKIVFSYLTIKINVTLTWSQAHKGTIAGRNVQRKLALLADCENWCLILSWVRQWVRIKQQFQLCINNNNNNSWWYYTNSALIQKFTPLPSLKTKNAEQKMTMIKNTTNFNSRFFSSLLNTENKFTSNI